MARSQKKPPMETTAPVNEGTAKAITEHHFKKAPKKVTKLTSGLSNFVYEVEVGKDTYIIRICDVPQKINQFLKEQWAVAKARERGVPGPEILEVGNEASSSPYMIIRKIKGEPAEKHPDRMAILTEMGKYSSVINTIPTTGFGNVFDWSNNTLSKNETWKDFVDKELNIKARLEVFERNDMHTKENMEKFRRALKDISEWDKSPTLNHCDMRIKNVIVDKKGKIVGIIDWENCMSNIAPFWEVSIALHDLTTDEKHAFLEGYGIREKDFRDMAWAIKAINMLNYAMHIDVLSEKNDGRTLEKYRLRLNGNLDLYSL